VASARLAGTLHPGVLMLRRDFLKCGAAAIAATRQDRAPAIVTRDAARPGVPFGVSTGDVTDDRAIVWSRTDRPARLVVEYSTTPSFADTRRVIGPAALDDPPGIHHRHAVAHSAEMMHDMDEHMVRGPSIEHGIGEGANVFMSAVFKGREFINTIEGKFASYELSQASLDGLISVKSTMFSAFRAAEKELGERANLADPSQEKASGQSS
jgi:hypothetical protein